ATLTLGPTTARFTRVLAQADRWVLVGNPSSTMTLPIRGADSAMMYAGDNNYQPVNELQPGQGAWVMRHTAGDVTVGDAPSSAQRTQVRRLQQGPAQNAADSSNFAAIPAVAGELIGNHAYDQVQEAMDDLRSSFQDGLRLAHAADTPALTEV